MSQNNLTTSDFDRLHESIQSVFETLRKMLQSRFPKLTAKSGRTATQKFPLYSYVTIEDQARPEIDPIVVGIDVRVDTGEIVIHANMIGEETGEAHLDLPNQELPFGTDLGLLIAQVAESAQRLADHAVPIVEAVFEYAKPIPAQALHR